MTLVPVVREFVLVVGSFASEFVLVVRAAPAFPVLLLAFASRAAYVALAIVGARGLPGFVELLATIDSIPAPFVLLLVTLSSPFTGVAASGARGVRFRPPLSVL